MKRSIILLRRRHSEIELPIDGTTGSTNTSQTSIIDGGNDVLNSDSAATLRSSNVGIGKREPRLITTRTNGNHISNTHAHPIHGNNPQSSSPPRNTTSSSATTNNKDDVWNNSGLEDIEPPANAYRKRNCIVFGLSLFSLIVISTGIHVFLIERMDRKYRLKDVSNTGTIDDNNSNALNFPLGDDTSSSNPIQTDSSSSTRGGSNSVGSSGGYSAATPGGGLLVTDVLKRQEEIEQCLTRRQQRQKKQKQGTQQQQSSTSSSSMYDINGRFILEDYDSKPTFSNFLPGVAGLYGKPLWSFYVNRGQAIASFGTLSKNYPILEYNPANKAYQNTPYLGFRTFIHGTREVNVTSTQTTTGSSSSATTPTSTTFDNNDSTTTTTTTPSDGSNNSNSDTATTSSTTSSSSKATKQTFLYEPFSPSQTNHYITAIDTLRRELQQEKKEASIKQASYASSPSSSSYTSSTTTTSTSSTNSTGTTTDKEQLLLQQKAERIEEAMLRDIDNDPILTNFIAEHCLEEEILPKRIMYIGGNEIQIQEIDIQHGLEVNVSYFVLPEENYGSFVKRTTILNTDPTSSITISVLDGLAKIEPIATRTDRDGADIGGIREEDSGGGGVGTDTIGSYSSFSVNEDGRHVSHMDEMLKHMGRTLEGYFKVDHADDENYTMPFFKSDIVPTDDATVEILKSGHYCISVWEKSDRQQSYESDKYNDSLLPIVYDTEQIFGEDTTLQRPAGLLVNYKNARTFSNRNSIQAILDKNNKQYGSAKTSSAMGGLKETTLEPGESVTINTLYGMSQTITDVPLIARKAIQRGYIYYKLNRSREIIQQLTSSVQTKTSNMLWDEHVKQMFMDNGLRGGIPMILGDIDDRTSMRSSDEDTRLKVYYVFSRQHGDLERDYNNFVLDPTYFSQGPGNYRDILQNRRTSVQFHPRVGSHDVYTFLSFVQADGYNPLKGEASVFVIKDEQQCDRLATMAVGSAVGHRAQRDSLEHILCNGPFRPGQLFLLMEEQHIELIMDRQRFIDEVVSVSRSYPMAVYGDGYWSDHWTYYMDLIESYLSIYPDREYELLFDSKLNYFYSASSIKPRSEKYVLSYTIDGWGKHVRQLNSTICPDIDKFNIQMNYREASTGWYTLEANWQHDVHGFLFTSTPISKLFLLATLKFATRDAYGMGIEYEGGKPGWNDAMNGLVGMVGSGMSETYELKRLLKYLFNAISIHKQPIIIPQELKIYLLDEIDIAITKLRHSNSTDVQYLLDSLTNEFLLDVPEPFFIYWDTISNAREVYRHHTRFNFSGVTSELSVNYLLKTIGIWIEEINGGIDRALRIGCHGGSTSEKKYKRNMLGKSVITPTYFSYDITRWTLTGQTTSNGLPLVNATSMRVKRFNMYLEGPTRQMVTFDNKQDSIELYNNIKNSNLRDDKLQMYTISDSLQGQSIDIGRSMAFAKGWLENQSIWLHMSYKYYLSLLKNKLYDEFYNEMINGGMLPFMNQYIYGRSLLECSSFIVSSVFEDPNKHGRGYMARFSGATSEFLSMYILMFIGPQPFFVDEETGQLSMQLVPSLPLWFFEGGDTTNTTTTKVINETENTITATTTTTTAATSVKNKAARKEEEEQPPSTRHKFFRSLLLRHHREEQEQQQQQQRSLLQDNNNNNPDTTATAATTTTTASNANITQQHEQQNERQMMGIVGSILNAFGSSSSNSSNGSEANTDNSNTITSNKQPQTTTTTTKLTGSTESNNNNQQHSTTGTDNTTTNNNNNTTDDDDPPKIMFTLFGTIHVTYHNILRENLFNIHPNKYIVNFKDGSQHTVNDSVIRGDLAIKIRGQLMVDSIHAYFG